MCCKVTIIIIIIITFGGAIYSINLYSTVYQSCHLTNSLKSYFVFSGNRAFSGRGDHIFLSSFGACTIDCNQTENLFDCIGVFTFNNPRVNTTATLPTKFGLLKEPVLLFPGIPSQLPLVANDSEGSKVTNVSYQASIAGNNVTMLVDPAYEYVSANVLGGPGENSILRLAALSTYISILMDVILEKCPPGYVMRDKACICSALTYYGLLNVILKHTSAMECGRENVTIQLSVQLIAPLVSALTIQLTVQGHCTIHSPWR